VLAAAQRYIGIVRERGITLEEVFSYDHLPTSHLVDGDFTSATPDNSKRVAQLEAYLIDQFVVGIGERSSIDDGLKTVTLLDVMPMVRQYINLSCFDQFGRV